MKSHRVMVTNRNRVAYRRKKEPLELLLIRKAMDIGPLNVMFLTGMVLTWGTNFSLSSNLAPWSMVFFLLSRPLSNQIISARNNLCSNTWHATFILHQLILFFSGFVLFVYISYLCSQTTSYLTCKIYGWFIFPSITHISIPNNKQMS